MRPLVKVWVGMVVGGSEERFEGQIACASVDQGRAQEYLGDGLGRFADIHAAHLTSKLKGAVSDFLDLSIALPKQACRAGLVSPYRQLRHGK